MRPILMLAAVSFVAACGARELAGGSKSIYTLTKDDFANHRDAIVSSTASACTGQTCLQVEKGDLLLLTATGSLQTSLGAAGPEGTAAWGGNPFTFVNRPAFGLYGRINSSVFLIGRETVVVAPSSGALEVVVNGCTSSAMFTIDCSTTGSFSVSISSKLASGVTLASTPALTDNSAGVPTMVSVKAADGWQSTGVALEKGQKVFVTASGTFAAGGSGTLDANGEPSGSNGGTAYQLVNRFAYRLYGRVNDNILELGTDGAFLSPSKGTLELVLNHPGDATGTIQVEVSKGAIPARGLLHADVAALAQTGTFSVPSSGAWSTSSVQVKRGAPILVSATGQLTGTSVPGGTVGPFGEGGVGGSSYVLTNRPRFALFGRVGSQAFFLGGENAVLSPATGTLELVINNAPGCASCGSSIPCSFCDVTGSFSVAVSAP